MNFGAPHFQVSRALKQFQTLTFWLLKKRQLMVLLKCSNDLDGDLFIKNKNKKLHQNPTSSAVHVGCFFHSSQTSNVHTPAELLIRPIDVRSLICVWIHVPWSKHGIWVSRSFHHCWESFQFPEINPVEWKRFGPKTSMLEERMAPRTKGESDLPLVNSKPMFLSKVCLLL